ncbi:type IV secretory system conjugative DNA transfer family protein [Candidatus Coxiella mudrowiae]|nr:type IV secretory system conjugative DNA transfer family protein [Candidatus Coxiella mudrowiae]
MFATNLNRLKHDYLGMLLYRKLLAQRDDYFSCRH